MVSETLTLNRTNQLNDVTSREHELLIIGGGITGAGILLDAQSRGIECCLIEMQDFAAGTSNRSTKLVHGGLRYLKQFEVGLVAEVGKERAIVYENGPHVTTPLWMLLPIVEGGTFGRLSTSFGIWLYDRLAAVKHSERRKMLSRNQALNKEPLLKTDGLKGGGYYVEYRTDDARLTLEIIKEALHRGAAAVNYTKAEEFIYENGRVVGVKAKDMISGEEFEIRAKNVVNATGPWVDELRELDRSKEGKTLHWTKGVHIVVDAKRFPLKNPVYFDAPDGRMLFAIPREGKTYIGTTDTNFKEDLLYPRMTAQDRDYILKMTNYMFPSVDLRPEDVESSWAGVRPLIHEEGKGPSEISRKDEVFHSKSGLLTIAGGKLTGYRKMAEKVVDIVAGRISTETGRHFPKCFTDKIEMSGGKFGGSENFPSFVTEQVAKGKTLGLTEQEASRLVHRYGTNIADVYSYLEDAASDIPEDMSKELYASLRYSLDFELTITPSDYFIRRTGALYFDIHWVKQYRDAAIAFMADELDWSDETKRAYEQDLEDRIRDATVAIGEESRQAVIS